MPSHGKSWKIFLGEPAIQHESHENGDCVVEDPEPYQVEESEHQIAYRECHEVQCAVDHTGVFVLFRRIGNSEQRVAQCHPEVIDQGKPAEDHSPFGHYAQPKPEHVIRFCDKRQHQQCHQV